jgi:hypothetical protein
MTAIPLAMLPPEVQDAIARGERVDILDAGRKVGEIGPEVVEESNEARTLRRIREAGLQVTPAPGRPNSGGWLGCMGGTTRVLGDVVAPADESDEWEALRG